MNDKAVINVIQSLPPMPSVVNQLCELTTKPDVELSAVVNCLAKDPLLTARVMKLANSSFYGFSAEVTSLEKAVMILGLKCIRNMGLTLSVLKAQNTLNDVGVDIEEFNFHSMATATLLQQLVKHFDPTYADDALIVGIIFDLGKLVMAKAHEDKYLDHIAACKESGEPLEMRESQLFSQTHKECTILVCQYLNLPSSITDAISDEKPFSQLVYAVKNLLRLAKIGDDCSTSVDTEKLLPLLQGPLFNITKTALSGIVEDSQAMMEVLGSHHQLNKQAENKNIGILCKQPQNELLAIATLLGLNHKILTADDIRHSPESIDIALTDSILSIGNQKYTQDHQIHVLDIHDWMQSADFKERIKVNSYYDALKQELSTYVK